MSTVAFGPFGQLKLAGQPPQVLALRHQGVDKPKRLVSHRAGMCSAISPTVLCAPAVTALRLVLGAAHAGLFGIGGLKLAFIPPGFNSRALGALVGNQILISALNTIATGADAALLLHIEFKTWLSGGDGWLLLAGRKGRHEKAHADVTCGLV